MTTTTPTLPIADITIDASVNPRLDIDADALGELTASIKELGVLEPVLVQPAADGKGYTLIAGARRLAAAKKAGLKEVPVHVRADLNGGALAAAIVENIIREDLTPVEEAEALAELQEREKLSLRDLGKRVGKSKDYVAQRLKLRALPEKAKRAVADGTLQLHAIPNVVKVAEKAPAVADLLVELADRYDLAKGEDLAEALWEIAEGDVSLWTPTGVRPVDLPIKDGAELEARAQEATKVLNGYGRRDVAPAGLADAARAFGCLLEIERGPGYRSEQYVTDGEWLAEQVRAEVERLEAEAAKKPKAKASPTSPGSAKTPANAPAAEQAEKDKRRKEREKEEKARITARGHNLELGVKLAKTFTAPKLTADVVRFLAELALDNRLDVAYRGVRYVDERLQTVETLKNGKQKITYADAPAAAKLLRADLDKAKTPEQIAGVVLKAMAAAQYATQDVVAPSARAWWNVPGNSSYSGAKGPVGKLIEKIAAKVVPPALQKKRGR